ncbi:MAG: UbiA family prenyltransferase [Deltaproteobacteria bacterium]|nr:UbiA family prenyltransferase [Deltaproteobacteria bacterium]
MDPAVQPRDDIGKPRDDIGMFKALTTFFLHLRLPMQFTLAPFFIAGASFAGRSWTPALLVDFLLAHAALYGGCTAFNSYYDKDEGPIAFMKKPLAMEPWMLPASVILQLIAVFYFFARDVPAGAVSTSMFLLGVAYSHPLIRLKKRLWGSLITVAIGQGGLALFLGFFVAGGRTLRGEFFLCLLGSMLLAVGFYFVTQIFQIEEDRSRGDRTLGTILGPRKTLYVTWCLVALGGALFLSSWFRGLVALIPALAFAPVVALWKKKIETWNSERNHDIAMMLVLVCSLACLGFLLMFG